MTSSAFLFSREAGLPLHLYKVILGFGEDGGGENRRQLIRKLKKQIKTTELNEALVTGVKMED